MHTPMHTLMLFAAHSDIPQLLMGTLRHSIVFILEPELVVFTFSRVELHQSN